MFPGTVETTRWPSVRACQRISRFIILIGVHNIRMMTSVIVSVVIVKQEISVHQDLRRKNRT